MTRLLLTATIAALAIQPIFSQETPDSPTTGPATAEIETTTAVADATTTQAGRPRPGVQSRMAGLNFERRWEQAEKSYKAAGIPEEKIQQLKDLEQRVAEGMEKGERMDFASIRAERNKILTEEEQTKLRDARQKILQEMRAGKDAATTAAAAPE